MKALIVLRRYIIIINFLLIILSLFLANRIHRIWVSNEYQNVAQVTKEPRPTFPEPTLSDSQKLPRKAYKDIADKDLFRPERTEWQPPAQPEEANVATKGAPQISIHGIVISKDFKCAWIKAAGQKEKLQKISEGESIQDWKIRTIEPNTVSLAKGEETLKYNLIEPGKPKQRIIPNALAPQKPPNKEVKKQPEKPRQPRTRTRVKSKK